MTILVVVRKMKLFFGKDENLNYSTSSWFLQVHPGSLICLDTQLQFLQQPYFIILYTHIWIYYPLSFSAK